MKNRDKNNDPKKKGFYFKDYIESDIVINYKNSNLILLNLFNYNKSLGYQGTIPESMKHISYAELGHIFRGIYVWYWFTK